MPPASAGRAAPAASAPVTDWVVAAIPASGPDDATPVPSLAVDDEPEDAAAATTRTLTLQRESVHERFHDGDVVPLSEIPPDDENDTPPPPDDEAPVPPRAPVAVERPTAERAAPVAGPRAPRMNGIERVGEAVVRQVLGATFVREEPYAQPTRFH